jgi:uncharacterized protein YfeS
MKATFMTLDDEEHDPFNEPKQRSKRSREMMKEDFFWDCVDEDAPFGSDEGWEAYYSFRDWRSENPKAKLAEFLDEVMLERSAEYNEKLTTDDAIVQSVKYPKKAFLGKEYDPGVLDVSVIAICLGQLIDEGKIDPAIKQFARVAIARQSHKAFQPSKHRLKVLQACARVIQEA